jgi:hypothetical protein
MAGHVLSRCIIEMKKEARKLKKGDVIDGNN